MKREAVFRKQFRKDLDRIKRTGRDTTRLLEIIELLINSQPLPPNSRDHQLTGNLKDYRECHLGGDWLLNGVSPRILTFFSVIFRWIR